MNRCEVLVEKFDSPQEVCEYLPGMTTQLVAQMRFRGDGPPYIKASPRKVVYRRSALEAWLVSRERTQTGQAVA